MLCSVFFVYVFINTFIHKRLLKTKKNLSQEAYKIKWVYVLGNLSSMKDFAYYP